MVAQSGDIVCLGKEWYRFPSSFNLPNGVHAMFIKSEFSGLLPGEFAEADAMADWRDKYPGTWFTPDGMNDQNIEDPGKYVSLEAPETSSTF
jgi:alpha-1,2-mannosyltransferase